MAEAAWREFNCYEVLGVSEDATPAEIRAAYRDATRRAHPDQGGSHEAQVRVNLAFEVLSGSLRAEHDAFWRTLRSSRTRAGASRQPRRFTRTGNLENLWNRTDRLGDGRAGGGFTAAIEARLMQERQRLQDDVAFRERALLQDARERLLRPRTEALVALGLAMVMGWIALRFPLAWIAVAGLLLSLGRRLRGVVWQGRRFFVFSPHLIAQARAHALETAQASADHEAASLSGHQEALDELKSLLCQPTAPTDSPADLARRLAGAFFLIGYVPLRWQEDDNRLIIARNSSEVALQICPAGKRSLTVTQVAHVLSELRAARQREAYLFALSPISARARERAGESGVRCFDLSELNEWIPSLLHSGYRGPGGDPLVSLTRLGHFLNTL